MKVSRRSSWIAVSRRRHVRAVWLGRRTARCPQLAEPPDWRLANWAGARMTLEGRAVVAQARAGSLPLLGGVLCALSAMFAALTVIVATRPRPPALATELDQRLRGSPGQWRYSVASVARPAGAFPVMVVRRVRRCCRALAEVAPSRSRRDLHLGALARRRCRVRRQASRRPTHAEERSAPGGLRLRVPVGTHRGCRSARGRGDHRNARARPRSLGSNHGDRDRHRGRVRGRREQCRRWRAPQPRHRGRHAPGRVRDLGSCTRGLDSAHESGRQGAL